MKNLHVLPTDKPSRLRIGDNGNVVLGLIKDSIVSKNDNYTNQHIYITSDEDINENDYIITKDGRLIQVDYLLSKDLEEASKIILTTDQDLIKDGVQSIDDEFLEWFVKNPSCESVEVDRDEREVGNHLGGIATEYGDYKIIIPKEEPKQYPIGGYAPGFYRCTCVTCEQSFMGDKRAVQCESCAIETAQESTQEVPEKTKDLAYWKANAEEDYIKVPISVLRYITELEKRMYSEEDLKNAFHVGRLSQGREGDTNFEQWFEQFKKK
jgi:hypothetical protein